MSVQYITSSLDSVAPEPLGTGGGGTCPSTFGNG